MSNKLRILHHLTHGLGDAVQFTSVLRHLHKYRTDWHNHVVALLGKHSVFRGLADGYAHFGQAGHSDGPWYHTFSHGWYDYPGCHERYPSTKVVNCLLHDLAIEPDPELLSYQIHVSAEARQRIDQFLDTLPLADKAGFVVLHYKGNTSPPEKNLSHAQAQAFCTFLQRRGYLPMILDWDRRSPLPDGRTIICPNVDHPLWRGWGTGDAETIAALIDRAACFVGIDSGPQKVAMSRAVPSVGVWTMLHPVNYADLCESMIHLVPRDSWQWIKGPRGVGWDYFRARYRYREYGQLEDTLCEVVGELLKVGKVN
jgi:ADP-heptose:LPS heptosyltransferase